MIHQFGNIAGGGKFVTAPTGVSASVSANTVTVAFTAATYDGKEIATYTVTSTPAGFTGSGTSSPIVIGGLTADTAFTFTVTTDSTYGVRNTSSASNSVTPPYFPPYFPPFFPPYFPPYFPPFFPPFFPPYFPPFFPPFFPPYFPPFFPPYFPPHFGHACSVTGSSTTYVQCSAGNCFKPRTTYSCAPAGCTGCPGASDGDCSGPNCF